MAFMLAFFGLLFTLFLLSQLLSRQLGLLIYRISKNKDITVGLLAFIFLPGTVVHEFAHAAFAHALGVYVGKIELIPKIDGLNIKLGSVQIAETDPFRRFVIGVAPVLSGLVLILLSLGVYRIFENGAPWWALIILYYLIFQIGNAMFSSRRDMEGAAELFIALGLVAAILYMAGVKFFSVDLVYKFAERSTGFFTLGTGALIKIVLLDLGIILPAGIFNLLLGGRGKT